MTILLAPPRAPRRIGSPLLLGALILLGIMLLLGIVGPLITPISPYSVDILNIYAPSSSAHWLGTDDTGRDILSRILVGIGPTLAGPALVIAAATTLAVALAVSAAWFGGAIDAVISRALDVMFAIPGLILAILVVAVVGVGFGAPVVALAIAFTPTIARVLRAAALRERSLAYVAALQVQGASGWRICMRHIIPNLMPLIIVQIAVGYGYALLDLAAISYLGLGTQPPGSDLGLLIANGQPAILAGYPQQSIYAAVLVVLIILATNIVGDALSNRFEGSER